MLNVILCKFFESPVNATNFVALLSSYIPYTIVSKDVCMYAYHIYVCVIEPALTVAAVIHHSLPSLVATTRSSRLSCHCLPSANDGQACIMTATNLPKKLGLLPYKILLQKISTCSVINGITY